MPFTVHGYTRAMAFGRGKVILFGEHAAVYGYPAIAAALADGCEATAEAWPTARLEVAPWNVAFDAEQTRGDADAPELHRAFRVLLDGYGASWPNVRVRAHLRIPGGAGLGGSAALSVAVVRAIDDWLGRTQSVEAVAAAANQAERVFHGTPSGIDAAMAAGSGVALFRKGQPLEPIALARPLTLVIGHSGKAKDTKRMVDSVRQQRERDPKKVDAIFEGIESLANNARTALQLGDLAPLGHYMMENQRLLNCLMLSTSELEHMCRTAVEAGALGAKLTGGGGGGCMIALCAGPELATPVLDALRALGKDAFLVEVKP